MTDADAKLRALLRAEPEPAMDPRFRLGVFEQIERRQARMKLGLLLGLGSAATVAMAFLGPQLTDSFGRTAMEIAGLSIAGVAMAWSALQLKRPI